MAEEKCKHERAGESRYCPDCGKEVNPEPDPEIEANILAVLRKHGVIKAEPPKPKTLLDKLKEKK